MKLPPAFFFNINLESLLFHSSFCFSYVENITINYLTIYIPIRNIFISLDMGILFTDASVLATENNKEKRIILEMIYIKRNKNSNNFRTGIKNLHNSCNNIMKISMK